MKKRYISISSLIALLFTGLIMFTGSCYDDETRVTIHLQRNDLAAMGIQPEPELSIIDKILNFFSTPAEATSVPSWSDDRTDLILTVTNGSTVVMTTTIPANATTYTTSVPAGYTATLTITADTDWGYPTGNIHKNWGGQTTITLKPGEEIDITIQMMPMTYIYSVNMGTSTIDIFWRTNRISDTITVNSYRIYKSAEIDGDYTFLTETTSSATGEAYTPPSPPSKYYYRVSCVTSRGEGVMCDPVTW